MKLNGIIVKLWTGIVLMTVIILLLSMLFQTVFLYAFYKSEQVKQLERDCYKLAGNFATYDFNSYVPWDQAIRNVNDIIIATNIEPRITYKNGETDYKEGYMFGVKYMNKIMAGETVVDERRMSNKQRNLEYLLVGVPIKRLVEEKSPFKRPGRYADLVQLDDRATKVIGAIYIMTPLNKLETTVNAIRLQFLYILGGAILLASLLSYLLSQSFSKPLILINDAAKEIAKGNYNTTIDLKSNDEIKALGDTISDLSRQLSRVEQIRREFIANVSHELRTPLSYLQGYTEIMLDGLAETKEDQEKYLNIIAEETVRLKKMVDEILELSQIEAEQIQLKLTQFSLDQVIKRTLDKVYPIASKRKISIKYSNSSEDLFLCLGDENRIKQVLINLLNNGIKHSYNYGNIIVTVYRQGEKIYTCIRDYGEGIPEEDLPFIWNRFYTVDKAKSEESTGLGLAIVKNIIEAHGCEITVNSAPRHGTEFCFWLNSYTEITET